MFSLGFKYGKECEENNILNSFLKLCEIKNTNLTINEATIAIEKEEKLIINEKNRLISLFNKDGKEKIYFGNYSYFLKEDEKRTLAKFENYKNQQKMIKKMKKKYDRK